MEQTHVQRRTLFLLAEKKVMQKHKRNTKKNEWNKKL
jgi:hypothetical protein